MNEIERASEIISEISFCDWAHENGLCTYKSTGCSDCEISQAKLKTLSALREKAERENPKPLTLDELLDMNGKPLWIAIKDSKVHVCEIRCVILSNIYSEIGFGYTIVKFTDGSLCYLEDYMEKWLAYRYKPKEM